jgi:hypothetical protein
MSYVINKTNGAELVTLADTMIDQRSTNLTFIGKDVPNYGEYINENFVRMLENFADNIQPDKPVEGQLWFDNSVKQLKVYDGAGFKATSGVMVSASVPSTIGQGDFWLNPTTSQMYFHDGKTTNLLGPIYKPDQGMCGFKVETVFDELNVKHIVLKVFVASQLIGIYSKDTFNLRIADVESNLGFIQAGYNSVNQLSSTFHGTVDAAHAIVTDTGTLTADEILTTSGGTVNGTLSVSDLPITDFDVVNLMALKQQQLVISLNTASLSESDIINILDSLYPVVDYQTSTAGPVCKVISLETNTISQYIISSGIWQVSN